MSSVFFQAGESNEIINCPHHTLQQSATPNSYSHTFKPVLDPSSFSSLGRHVRYLRALSERGLSEYETRLDQHLHELKRLRCLYGYKIKAGNAQNTNKICLVSRDSPSPSSSFGWVLSVSVCRHLIDCCHRWRVLSGC